MNKKYFKLPIFLVLAWIFAFIYEEIPRTFIGKVPGTVHLWESGEGWFPFFLIWYGVIFLIAYFLFINKNVKYAVIFGVVWGIIVETFYFKKLDSLFAFVLFALLYLGMFYFPFKIILSIYNKKEKTKRSEKWIIIISQGIVFGMLVLIWLVG